MPPLINPGSFRDPSGFVYVKDDILYRQINKCYAEEYDALCASGLLEHLQERNMAVRHEEADMGSAATPDAYRIIKLQRIPYISYPYEWSFSQLKDAALLTLAIEREALKRGLTLKDASSFNVQFIGSKPVFIDTLSFERSVEGEPWIAYGQFCRHFLAPLALMSYRDIGLGHLQRVYIDGIPLDLAKLLLPFTTVFNFGILIHLKLHAGAQKKTADRADISINNLKKLKNPPRINRTGLAGIIDSLENTVAGLHWKPEGTEWAEYYRNTNYTEKAFLHKKNIVEQAVAVIRPQTVWDIGANDGTFSRIAAQNGAYTVSFDIDPAAVETNYLSGKKSGPSNLLPLFLDVTNPSPGLGWNNEERMNWRQRGRADMVFALAIAHHLAIGNNLPFKMIASFFSSICDYLLIEFIPKTDSQVQRMLRNRKDIFSGYSEEKFRTDFRIYFEVRSRIPVNESDRVIFLMQRNPQDYPHR